ncbi:hypothetical protein MMC22_010960 [Lobaria immixta]|nr:hypothetical protein [Lobaria immixta]
MSSALITAAMTPYRLRNIREWLEREQQTRPAHEARMREYEARFQEHKARFQIQEALFQASEAQLQARETQFQEHKAIFQHHEAQIQKWREYDAELRKCREHNTLVLEGKDPVTQWFRGKASTIASIVTKMQIGLQTRSAHAAGSGHQTQSTLLGLSPQSSSAAAIPKSSVWGWPFVSGNVPPPGKRCSTREISGRHGK